jgi:ATP-dependent helicase/nuclease subunit B
MIPAVFTIPADRPFLDTLVAGLAARAGDDPLAVARHTILLPTRRAVRALRDAFLRTSGGRPLLLPRLVPVGDLDAEELALFADEAEGADADLNLPPAVPDLQRRLLLTRLVLAWGRAQESGPLMPGQAAPLAAELARFLDEVQAERRDFAGLAALAPEDYAEHWQQILRFLTILTEHWPKALAEIGCLDPAERRNRVLSAQIARWQRSPPQDPVIAAGITGGMPAVADLVAAVASLPQGMVVLPGLDRDGDAESWDEIALDPAHPQHLMARLLARLDLAPADVRVWETPGATASPPARRRVVTEALCPAAISHRWRDLQGIDAVALDGLLRLDCPGPQEEALAIALLLRQRLEHPGETAALVTPDRALARRVASELKRWNIEIDDSAGVPLNKTPPGVFLRLLLDAVAEGFAPLPLLALLKHPLSAAGSRPEGFRALTRRLEVAVLRGPRPAPGLAALGQTLDAKETILNGFLATLEAVFEPLVAALDADEITLPRLVAAHVAAAEALSASDEEAGAQRLWREPAGEAAAQFVSDLLQAAAEFPPLAGRDYPALFEALLAGPVVRPPYGRHPRLFIWGLLEARLQHADLVILGGLNEGIWPPETESDPWLSRPMRRAFGLAPPERRIGVAAHDFAQAMGAREVVLTRAARVEGAPTVPSRWLLRLDTVLRAVGLEGRLGAAREPLAWQALLDKPAERLLLSPPEPRPPVVARPRQLSVTEIETWMRDPYAIYARHVLRLKALDPLDADPGAAERGAFIHEALDMFAHTFPAALPADAEARLLECGRAAFGAALARPGVWAFWWPRFERMAQWLVAVEAERRPLLAALGSEIRGELMLDGPEGPFRLTGKADRIDRRRDGGLVIIDYKTGAVPASGDVKLGFSPQLPLEAAIAEAGGFAGIAAGAVVELAHWRLSGGDPPGEEKPVAKGDAELRQLVAEALKGLAELIARFDDERTPYRAWPRPEKAPRYSDYPHLARVKEWLLGAGVGE